MFQRQIHRVDPKIWQECAGDSATVLRLKSKLYYFPRGHLEHACPNYPTTQTLSLIDRCRPFILCVVSSVDLFADSETDELVAKLLLTPLTDGSIVPSDYGDKDDGDQVVSYAKTLTQSDANNGGALSVPVKCAKSIFPPLDYNTESPSQNVSVTDFHGVVWNFRHVYTGTPKRHLITHGWSAFADHKKLISGDTIVFVKNLAGKITIGLRRKMRLAAAANISVEAVTKAAELANKNTTFEVIYHPTTGGFDFVVGNKVVEDAMKIHWSLGMSVKYTMKINDDTSKGCFVFHGTISTLSPPYICPWRMLKVDWNEHEVLESLTKVSPWQVELIFNIPTRHLPSPPTENPSKKELGVPKNSTLLSDMEGGHFIPKRDTSNSSIGLLNQTVLKYDSMKKLVSVPTEKNINGFVSSDDFSFNSHLNSLDTKTVSTHISNDKEVTRSIVLFGQTILVKRNRWNDFNFREDNNKNINEIEDTEKLPKK